MIVRFFGMYVSFLVAGGKFDFLFFYIGARHLLVSHPVKRILPLMTPITNFYEDAVKMKPFNFGSNGDSTLNESFHVETDRHAWYVNTFLYQPCAVTLHTVYQQNC